MKQPGNETADTVLKKLDEQYQKYKFMELNLAQKKRRFAFAFSLTILADMARVYNWDVKRRNKDDSTKNKA
ncbi:hypothetical protein GH733_019533 [Mirounga leonina]|nr:hypothetical protein GH733_019533 [Mirounga leonina]